MFFVWGFFLLQLLIKPLYPLLLGFEPEARVLKESACAPRTFLQNTAESSTGSNLIHAKIPVPLPFFLTRCQEKPHGHAVCQHISTAGVVAESQQTAANSWTCCGWKTTHSLSQFLTLISHSSASTAYPVQTCAFIPTGKGTLKAVHFPGSPHSLLHIWGSRNRGSVMTWYL